MFDITTQGNTGLTGSDTSACSGKLSSGMRTPAIAMIDAGVAGRHDADFGVRISPRVVSTAATAPSVAADPRHLAVLDDVDAERIGAARIAPRDRVVARNAAAPLQRAAEHRIADVARDVERRAERLALLRRQPLVVDAIEPVGMDMALEHLDVVNGVREHHHAARREHHIVIELLRQAFPELQRVVVDRGAFVPEIVRADDRRVAPGVAAAEPALLQHRHIGDAVFFRQIVGGRQPMPAAPTITTS